MDVALLARLQFALTIIFHYLFPPLTIGLSVILVYLQFKYIRTKDLKFDIATNFWIKIFSLNFAMGVLSGIVMEFQFGTNWATYSRFVGDVFGSPLAIEGVFAFFLESVFLGVLLFGKERVSKFFYFFSTCMVSLGSILSSIWIIVANSWQQTPAGHHIVPILKNGKPWVVNGEVMMRAEIVDFWQMVFNPSSIIRLTHTLIGCFIMGAFLVMSISAWYILKNKHLEFAKTNFKIGLVSALFFSLLALVTGHEHAINVYKHQPQKLAAFEGHYKTGRGNLTLFGIPQKEPLELKYKVEIPGALGFLLSFNSNQEVIGLDKFKPKDRPPLIIPFITWRLMIGLGMFFIGITFLGTFFLYRGTLFRKKWLMWVFVLSVFPAVLANQVGWIGAEVGRQPWIVHPPTPWVGVDKLKLGEDGYVQYEEGKGLRTLDAISKKVEKEQVIISLVMFSILYAVLTALWLFVFYKKIEHGPDDF